MTRILIDALSTFDTPIDTLWATKEALEQELRSRVADELKVLDQRKKLLLSIVTSTIATVSD